VSINQFIATAVAMKMSALLTGDYLEERAQRGIRAHLQSVPRRVPDAPPLPGDEWPVSDAAAVRERTQLPRERRAAKARHVGKRLRWPSRRWGGRDEAPV
jgi:hypothetical protein